MDGERITKEDLASRIAGLRASILRTNSTDETLGDEQLARAAVAAAVLDHLLYAEAVRVGEVISEEEAVELSRQAYETFHASADPNKYEYLPPGTTAEGVFLSDDNVKGLRRLMTLRRMRDKVIAQRNLSPDPDRSAERDWLRNELPSHDVKISGIAGLKRSDLPAYVPGRTIRS